MRVNARRNSITEGLTALLAASSIAKSVSEDQNALLVRRQLEDSFVRGGLHSKVAKVGGVMASLPQSLGYQRSKRVVDQESHSLATNGNSRSSNASAAYLSA